MRSRAYWRTSSGSRTALYGVAGAELTAKALVQAQKFGAEIKSPFEVTSLRIAD
jgi:hypothetical protein